jgi:hypothetical protein
MAIIQSAASTDLATVDSTQKALRSVIKPDEMVGYFNLAAATGSITTLAANGPIFSFRWAPGTGQVCVIKRVSISFTATTGFTAGQQMGYGLYFARSFSASDTVGTAITPILGASQKSRTTQMTSMVTDARISAAAVLTAGTRTLDTQALGTTYFYAPTTTAGTLLSNTNLISYNIDDYPLVLQNNEGFVITNLVLMGAGGVGTAVVNVEWFEANSY